MLIEPANYNEKNESSEKTKKLLKNIKKEFPTLIQTPDKESGRIFISLIELSQTDFNTDEKVGNLLGFPCAKEFNIIDRSKRTYSYNILVIFKDTSVINLITDLCQNKSFEEHKPLLKSIKDALKHDDRIWDLIKDIIIKEDEIIPVNDLIPRIMKGHLTDEEGWALKNVLYNLGFESLMDYNFQYTNPIHKGILLSLIIYSENNVLTPFYPLQLTDHLDEINLIRSKWEDNLIKMLDTSRVKNKNTTRRNN